jgi:hypothetical protein
MRPLIVRAHIVTAGFLVSVAACSSPEDAGEQVADACNESSLIGQCPPGSSPLFGSAGQSACGGQGGVDIIAGTGEVSGRCIAAGQCVVACQFDTPCECGVAAVTTEGVFCRPCEGQAVCGNGVCEGGEDPELCSADCRADCVAGDRRCADIRVLEECNQRGRYEQIACRDYEVCDVANGGGAMCRRADVLAGFEPAAVEDDVEVPPGRIWRQAGEYSTTGTLDLPEPGNTLAFVYGDAACVLGRTPNVCQVGDIGFALDGPPTWSPAPGDRSFYFWTGSTYAETDGRGIPIAEGSGQRATLVLPVRVDLPAGNPAHPTISADATTMLHWVADTLADGEPEIAGGGPPMRLMRASLETGEVTELWRTRNYAPVYGSYPIALAADGSSALLRLFTYTSSYAYNERCNCQYFGTYAGPVASAFLETESGALSFVPGVHADRDGSISALSPNAQFAATVRNAQRILVDEQTVSGNAIEVRNLLDNEVVLSILPTAEASASRAYFGAFEHELVIETARGIELWRLDTPALVRQIPSSALGLTAAVAPNGRRVAVATTNELRLLSLETGEMLSSVAVETTDDASHALTWDRTGTRVVWRRAFARPVDDVVYRFDVFEVLP